MKDLLVPARTIRTDTSEKRREVLRCFNGTPARITSDSATKIVTSVPTGATTGKISVTTPAGTASSPSPFSVTAALASRERFWSLASVVLANELTVHRPFGTRLPTTVVGLATGVKLAFEGTVSPLTGFFDQAQLRSGHGVIFSRS